MTSSNVIKRQNSITEFFQSKKQKTLDQPSNNKSIEVQELNEFKKNFIKSLTKEQLNLLNLEILTLEDSWFESLYLEFTKPYFLNLKKFLNQQLLQSNKIFPLSNDIYSWSRLTPFNQVKVIILGQDPYHNDNQAHGLAFSVKFPTVPPPSLKNMFKAIKIDYPNFEIPNGSGDLTKWANQGVLLLNTCLTVKAHNANSHSKKGWEQFTEMVLQKLIMESTLNNNKLVLMLWGTPAQNRFLKIQKLIDEKIVNREDCLLILKSVHPSPLSARRGYFESHHYRLCNEWLIEKGLDPIDWGLVPGNTIL
ncbi:hypothetical protein WICMUC_002408 [Wickerhamomyces mucosus]|uniref:Uracil-DNA glycosylase n=1 Tax=Wickerhamomyces mucosus TaxID=1378264 RepID=A0A9P8TEP4_9ASCO|nr:hypothetical protein WICMUC_002408 [Wickerhamomyces mucosus]